MLLHKLGVALMISVRFFNFESVQIFPSTLTLKIISAQTGVSYIQWIPRIADTSGREHLSVLSGCP